ncbi:hypothetical protein CH373_15385 [Leptospira perolatii]|uniref:Integrin n=1 Tax=Leptospira perolatii TaxID=2023191 RepID=A0A2M9ZJR8_9LEPT|nr:FG-GAP repeat protein [Leptospira perolatii]PJZ69473.1 hypothetical protein CH360_10725 [Leptospira perolatii]PJZ72298.1 hypothetical protein CH373_15385 [Leptospira perolatii]
MKFKKCIFFVTLLMFVACDETEKYSHRDYIKVHNSGENDELGQRGIAIDGDLMVLGSPYEASSLGGINPGNSGSDNSTPGAGAAYLFFKNEAGNWQQGQFIKAPAPQEYAYFASSIAISGNFILIGAPNENLSSSMIDSGVVHVYSYDRQTRVLEYAGLLRAPELHPYVRFGTSISMNGNWVAIGSPLEDVLDSSGNPVRKVGKTYLFERIENSITFRFRSVLQPNFLATSNFYGSSVSISGDWLVVGAPGGNKNGIYIYQKDSSGNWNFKQSFLPDGYWRVGESVAIDGYTLAAGASAYNAPRGGETAPRSGGVFVLRLINGNWEHEKILYPVYPDTDDAFGISVSLSGNLLVVGAPYEDSAVEDYGYQDNNNSPDSGAVFIYERTESNGTVEWKLDYMLKGSVIETGDYYGSAVAISKNRIAIGSPREDGDGTGINGDPTNNNKSNSGAAFVVERTSN